ncbi:MAG: hypothetical protein K9N09_04775 [Candidatus Cloacimonetes bacterium]|nr:hypothetical protein [Candidatus Cloacimonadota bacterium]MCF7883454.1 hypothetical protein [Candidatus Cloacimonadota bacterium]
MQFVERYEKVKRATFEPDKSIGTAGKSVLKPLLNASQKELWQIYFLAGQG